ncbi:MAG: dephospho-CoA kinase [Elainella sp. C42_A2020_010]|nr:dephospho-CoA kinase [Elainella sp. C42_A2020_010]RNJ70157.1 MAG: dephospho-CoA kinase [Leptolyngbya sp. IPPAS B-1204]
MGTAMRIIGLTGGVGMGKTTVSEYLKTRYKLPILDADVYARAAVEPDSPILSRLAERYGPEILLPTGALNRSRLGDILFNDAAERRWIEQQIHPYVRHQMTTDLHRLVDQGCPTVVLVIPLLFEAGLTDLVTEIWVVSASQQQQIERLKQRDRLNLNQIQARIASQMPITAKIAQADVVLDNSSSSEALFQQVDQALMGRD